MLAAADDGGGDSTQSYFGTPERRTSLLPSTPQSSSASQQASQSSPGKSRWLRPAAIGVGAIGLNGLAYLLLPPHVLNRLGAFGYMSAFGVAGIANASVVIPVPYYSIIARLAQTPVLDVRGVVIAAAAGSALGELVAFLVGRAGKEIASETRFYRWVQTQMQHPSRTMLILFLLSAPPNPAFDVAGLLAGALGIPMWMFLIPVFLGRIVRMGLVALVGTGLHPFP